MAFRHRKRGSRKWENARAKKERIRLVRAIEPPPHEFPEVRREIIVRDYDFGLVEHHFVLKKTNRIDSYFIEVDRVRVDKLGWTGVMRLAEKAFMRVGSLNNS